MKRRVLMGWALVSALLLMLVLSGCTSKVSSMNEKERIDYARNGVVRVVSEMPNGYGTGSAFGVGKAGEPTDIFVTNRHVVVEEDRNPDGSYKLAHRVYLSLDSNSIDITTYAAEVDGSMVVVDKDLDYNTDRMVECDVLFFSDTYDFAILKATRPVDRIALPVLNDVEDKLVSSQTVYVLGYPSVSDQTMSSSEWKLTNKTYQGNPVYSMTMTRGSAVRDITVTQGGVSRFGEMVDENNTKTIQIDAAINSGNSGGPLLNGNGQVVGINTWSSSATETLSYSIYSDYVVKQLDEMKISYDTSWGPEIPVWVIALIAVAAVGLILVVVLLVLRRPRPAASAAPVAPVQAPPVQREFRLQGQSGTFTGRRFSINGQVRIGRDPTRNDLVYPGDAGGVSGVHCVVSQSGGQLTLTDLGSSYGTFLQGRKLTPHQPAPLQMGDRFWLGSERETFVITGRGGNLQ